MTSSLSSAGGIIDNILPLFLHGGGSMVSLAKSSNWKARGTSSLSTGGCFIRNGNNSVPEQRQSFGTDFLLRFDFNWVWLEDGMPLQYQTWAKCLDRLLLKLPKSLRLHL